MKFAARGAETYAFAAITLSLLLVIAGVGVIAQRNAFKTTLPMHVTVTGGVVGFNVTESLEFGSIPPSGVGRKTVFATNHLNAHKKIFVRAYGQMGEWISVSQNAIPAKPLEKLNFSVFVNVPENAKPGDYYGTLEITIG